MIFTTFLNPSSFLRKSVGPKFLSWIETPRAGLRAGESSWRRKTQPLGITYITGDNKHHTVANSQPILEFQPSSNELSHVFVVYVPNAYCTKRNARVLDRSTRAFLRQRPHTSKCAGNLTRMLPLCRSMRCFDFRCPRHHHPLTPSDACRNRHHKGT